MHNIMADMILKRKEEYKVFEDTEFKRNLTNNRIRTGRTEK